MSVERATRKDGSTVWRVRWREDGRNRSRTCGTKRDAEDVDREITRRRRVGQMVDFGRRAAGEDLDAPLEAAWKCSVRLIALPDESPCGSWLYAVANADFDRFKLGISSDINIVRRLGQHATSNGRPLVLLNVWAGREPDEHDLGDALKGRGLHIKGEWFRLEPWVLKILQDLR